MPAMEMRCEGSFQSASLAEASDRSAAMLRLLLRRASITGTRPEGLSQRDDGGSDDSGGGSNEEFGT